ncbi:MAG: hypothetical protein ABF651_00720 [Sporolactobacillus sp.]
MKAARGETGCSTKHVYEKLNVTRSKFRRLTTALEQQGYIFTRNRNNQRIFFEKDIQLFTHLLEETRRGTLLDDAAKAVCGNTHSSELAPTPPVNPLVPAQQIAESTLALSADQFRLVVEQVAATAAEKTAELVVRKYDREMERMIERRDRELVNRLRELSETGRKKRWLFRMLGSH